MYAHRWIMLNSLASLHFISNFNYFYVYTYQNFIRFGYKIIFLQCPLVGVCVCVNERCVRVLCVENIPFPVSLFHTIRCYDKVLCLVWKRCFFIYVRAPLPRLCLVSSWSMYEVWTKSNGRLLVCKTLKTFIHSVLQIMCAQLLVAYVCVYHFIWL